MQVALVAVFFLEEDSPLKAKERAFNRIERYFSKNIGEIFWDTEYNNRVTVNISSYYETWELAVYSFLKMCRSLGHSWVIRGNINSEFDSSTNHSRIVGAHGISVYVKNPDAHKNNLIITSESIKSASESEIDIMTAAIETENFRIKNEELNFLADYFQSIILILDEFPKSKYIDEFKERIISSIEDIRKDQDFESLYFEYFVKDFIFLVISTGNTKKYIEKLSILCIIENRVSIAYKNLDIYYDVGEYFHENWEIYTNNKNLIIEELIFDYCRKKYLDLINQRVDLTCISDDIKRDKYLSSSDGFYIRQRLIMELYEDIFSKQDDGINFLEYFRDVDDDIQKEIDRIRLESSE